MQRLSLGTALYRSVLAILLASFTVIAVGCKWVTIASVNANGDQGNNSSAFSSVSGDGRYVTFHTGASNLGGTPWVRTDVYVRDLLAGTTTHVSVDSNGVAGNDYSSNPSISADGRYITFFASSTNLVPSDTNGAYDIFLRDTVTGVTERISVDPQGAGGNGASFLPDISADGRFIAYWSDASNLVANDTNGRSDIFVYDRVLDVTVRASVDSNGSQGNFESRRPAISADGRYVAFDSFATNFAPGDTNQTADIFVHDIVTGDTELVSIDPGGNQFRGTSSKPDISADGQVVTFTHGWDVYVRDRGTGVTKRASADMGGGGGTEFGASKNAAISEDGRYVAFDSDADDLVPGDTGSYSDVYLYDRVSETIERLSVTSTGVEGDGYSIAPSFSGDGRYISFTTDASNLIPGGIFQVQVIVQALPTMSFSSVSPQQLAIGGTTAVTLTGSNFTPGMSLFFNATASNVVVVNETTITADVSVPANATPGAKNVSVGRYGTGPGLITGVAAFCLNCVTLF